MEACAALEQALRQNDRYASQLPPPEPAAEQDLYACLSRL